MRREKKRWDERGGAAGETRREEKRREEKRKTKARQGKTKHGKARRDKIKHDKTNTTRQGYDKDKDKTKTKQDKSHKTTQPQDKTKQDTYAGRGNAWETQKVLCKCFAYLHVANNINSLKGRELRKKRWIEMSLSCLVIVSSIVFSCVIRLVLWLFCLVIFSSCELSCLVKKDKHRTLIPYTQQPLGG